jgi:hypothetical protein
MSSQPAVGSQVNGVLRIALERVMNFGENPIGMRVLPLTEFTAVRRFPHFQAVSDQVHNSL